MGSTTEGLAREIEQKDPWWAGLENLGVILDGLVEAMVVGVHDLVNDVLNEIALLLEELDLALAVLRGENVHNVRQRVEPRCRPPLIDPRQPFLEVLRPGDDEKLELPIAIPGQRRIRREGTALGKRRGRGNSRICRPEWGGHRRCRGGARCGSSCRRQAAASRRGC